MTLSATDLKALHDIATEAALVAGRYIQRNVGKNIAVESKDGGTSHASSIVTEIDRQSQQIILDYLLPTCAQYDLALLTEENPDDGQRLIKDYFWCIDPLDGTLPFTESVEGYSVSIALVGRDGTPHIGIIYNPYRNKLYAAIRGQGCTVNRKAFTVPAINDCQRFVIYTDRSFATKPYGTKIKNSISMTAEEIGCAQVGFLSQGGAAMHACWALENAPGIYLKLPQREKGGGSLWDFAASACIYTEAGGWVSDIHGNPLNLNRYDSTFMNHRGVLYISDIKQARIFINVLAKELILLDL